jgi:putative ABC transport system permease protein
MRILDAARLRFRSLFRSGAVERELDAELRFHVEQHVRELIHHGVPPEEARTRALRAFGGVEQIKESVRDTWHVRLVRDLAQDLRYGLRSLSHAPTFTAVAVLTLALGIGATTAIFSVVDGILLRPLQYADSDRIVMLLSRFTKNGHVTPRLSGGDLQDVQSGLDVFDALSAYNGDEIGVRAGDRAELTGTWFVNPSFFRVFGVKPQAGRWLEEGDVDRAVVVSAGYAEQHFGAAGSALGRTLNIDTRTYEIAGVMPAGFHYPQLADVWVPVPDRPDNIDRTAYNYPTVAHLRPGVSRETANAALATLSDRLSAAYPDSNAGKVMAAVPLQERLVGSLRSTLFLLFGAVALLFLIACANVASLLLARATARSREMALRSALGADRLRIVRQLTVESLLLGLAGGVLGLAVAYGGTRSLIRLAPVDLPRLNEISVHPAVLGFAALVSLVASLIFGLVPAWQASNADLRGRLTEGGARGAVGTRSNRLRTSLAVAEIALAVVLAVGAGVLFRSFMALSTVDIGFHTADILVARANIPTTDDTADQRRAVDRFERLFPVLETIPGVESVSAAVGLPMGPTGSNGAFAVEGRHTFAPGVQLPYGNFRLTSPGFFSTMGIPLRHGRDFTTTDDYDHPFVVVVNETLARQVFNGEDPIGHRLQCGLDSLKYMTIVGVIGDIRDEPGTPPVPELYMPIAQHPGRGSLVELVLRATVPPGTLVEVVRQRIQQVDPEIATEFTPFEQLVTDAIATPRFRAWLIGAFAGLALLVAVAGIYGLLTYLTAQRTPELGVRMALGAGPLEVVGLVLRRAMAIAAGGLTTGIVLAAASSRALTKMVFGTSPTDPITYIGVAAVVFVVTIAAAAVPAWRASRIDPLVVLREQ